MTECFLPPTSSPSEHRRVEHGSGLTRTPSSEEIDLVQEEGAPDTTQEKAETQIQA